MRYFLTLLGTALFFSLPKDSIFGGVDAANTSQDKILAPEELQLHEGFAALYNHAKPFGSGKMHPKANDQLESPQHAKHVYAENCPNDYCDYVNGRSIKTSFREYPELSSLGYDRNYGDGAMLRVLTDPKTLCKDLYFKTSASVDNSFEPAEPSKTTDKNYQVTFYDGHGRQINSNEPTAASYYLACVNKAFMYANDNEFVAKFISEMLKNDLTRDYLNDLMLDLLHILKGDELRKFITEFNIPGIERVEINAPARLRAKL